MSSHINSESDSKTTTVSVTDTNDSDNDYCIFFMFVFCSIIAVDYEARKFGVKRNIQGNEAQQKCPTIQLVQVPEQRGKADLTRYRHAEAEVINVLSCYTSCIGWASIDEAFLDIMASVFEKMESLGFKNLTPFDLPATHSAEHFTPTAVDKQTDQGGDSLIAGNSSMLQHGNTESDDERHTFVSKTDADSVEWESGSLQPMQNQLDHPFTAVIAKHQETVMEKNEVDNSMSTQRAAEDKEALRVRLLEEWLSGEGRGAEMTLAVGALMARGIREAVLKETGFTCSAGIAHNKVCTLIHLHAHHIIVHCSTLSLRQKFQSCVMLSVCIFWGDSINIILQKFTVCISNKLT